MTPTHTFPPDPDPARYRTLLSTARQTGRCPVRLGHDALERSGFFPEPGDVIAAIDATDAATVLAGWWPGPCLPDCPCTEALPAELPPDPGGPDLSAAAGTIEEAVAFGPVDGLAVVEAARPADVPAALGWMGFGNYHPYQDVVRICAVLRRWEERYGALLAVVDDSRLHLSVAYPPTTDDECRRVAAEHFAFCPDQQDPQNGTVYTLTSYAAEIRGARSWTFWWD